jgi:hypothetical protein
VVQLRLFETEVKRRKGREVSYQLYMTRSSRRDSINVLDVLRNSGPQAILLCAVALGQVRVVDMKDSDRVGLIGLMKTNRHHPDINDPILRTLAVDYNIPSSVAGALLFLLVGHD